MKKEYKLIASDLDGTFLTKDQRVSPENLAAVAEIERRGVHFVPSTGRCINELPKEVSSTGDFFHQRCVVAKMKSLPLSLMRKTPRFHDFDLASLKMPS